MKLKCIENRVSANTLSIAVGDILRAFPIKGSQAFDIKDKTGLEWCVEPYLGKYAILTGGSNFTKMQLIARFEKVQETPKKPLTIQGN